MGKKAVRRSDLDEIWLSREVISELAAGLLLSIEGIGFYMSLLAFADTERNAVTPGAVEAALERKAKTDVLGELVKRNAVLPIAEGRGGYLVNPALGFRGCNALRLHVLMQPFLDAAAGWKTLVAGDFDTALLLEP